MVRVKWVDYKGTRFFKGDISATPPVNVRFLSFNSAIHSPRKLLCVQAPRSTKRSKKWVAAGLRAVWPDCWTPISGVAPNEASAIVSD